MTVLAYDKGGVPQEKPWDCGPASTQVVLDGLGIKVTEDELIREVGTTVNGTDYVGLIEKVLDKRVPQANYTSVYMPHDPPTQAEKDKLWADVSGSITAGYGVVMNWVAPPNNHPRALEGESPNYGGGTIWHYVACMGVDETRKAFWIADPGFRPFGYWVSFDQCATLIPPKGYCYAATSRPAAPTAPAPTAPAPAPAEPRPDFNEYWVPSTNNQPRRGVPVDLFLLHTEEGNSNADRLARWFHDPGVQVSYHYTVSQDPHDGGVTVCDVVSTQNAAWSCLSANNRSINLCFAGSSVNWTSQQWMDNSHALDAAAFIAVRDCRKHNIPIRVIPPPYGPPGGISDHAYVTQYLRDGTHTDVGPGFPWQYFAERVAFWSTGAAAAPPTAAPPAPPTAAPVGSADDQLTLRWNCLGGQTLVEAVADVRDRVCGTQDRNKTGVR